jgi:hypothetical protein
MKKRSKCLKPAELTYLLMIASLVGCTQKLEKMPDYETTYAECRTNPEQCRDEVVSDNTGATGSFDTNPNQNVVYGNHYNSGGSFWNHYLLYHMLFSNNGRSSYYQPYYSRHFSNYSVERAGTFSQRYRGSGVYTPGFVSRMKSSISSGKTSFVSSSGSIFKSSKFAGSSTHSSSGKVISRGGFGSTSRGFSLGS